MKKTKFFNKVEQKWVMIDAKGEVLGRLSTRIARILQGKHKATYSPNFLCGDKVVVINAKHIKITGNKLNNKIYDRYSGYPSGLKEKSMNYMVAKNPSKVLYLSIKGMLPKTLLAKSMIRGLKIYPEETHLQIAQKPTKIEV